MERIEITESELIAALLAVSETIDRSNPYNAKTTRELQSLTGRNENWVYERLRALKEQGRLGFVRLMRESINGAMRPVEAYYVTGNGDGNGKTKV